MFLIGEGIDKKKGRERERKGIRLKNREEN